MFFSVTSRRLDESILKRSDGLGTVTIIRAFYFRWRRGSSFRSLYWCTALPLSRPLLKTSLQPLQRLELLLLPEAWCGSCGELINGFALSVFSFSGLGLIISFSCLWRNACLEIALLDWYSNRFRCLFKFACSGAWFVCYAHVLWRSVVQFLLLNCFFDAEQLRSLGDLCRLRIAGYLIRLLAYSTSQHLLLDEAHR